LEMLQMGSFREGERCLFSFSFQLKQKGTFLFPS